MALQRMGVEDFVTNAGRREGSGRTEEKEMIFGRVCSFFNLGLWGAILAEATIRHIGWQMVLAFVVLTMSAIHLEGTK